MVGVVDTVALAGEAPTYASEVQDQLFCFRSSSLLVHLGSQEKMTWALATHVGDLAPHSWL